jgi:hypothetical protein
MSNKEAKIREALNIVKWTSKKLELILLELEQEDIKNVQS